MYMKKIIIIAALFCSFAASAQKTTPGNYTYIAQKYEWDAGIFKGLGIPSGSGPAAFITGQVGRAGALYYDSVGIDSGLYVYSGLAWRLLGEGEVTQSALNDTASAIRGDFPVYTSSNGLYKSGNDFRLGGPLGTPSIFTEQRVINLNNKSLYFTKNYGSTPVLGTGDYAPIYGEFIDSVTSSSMSLSTLPTAATWWSRVFRVTGNFANSFKVGHIQTMKYEFGDTARLVSNGGDFGGAVFNTLYLGYLPSKTTGRAAIQGGVVDFEATYAAISNVELPYSNASRHLRVHGWLSAHHAYLRMINQPDTIDNFIFYQAASFKESAAKVLKSYAFYANGVPSDSSWSFYSPLTVNRFYQNGSMSIGGGYTSSPYKFRVHGDSYFYDSVYLNTAREVLDTAGIDVIARKRTDGSLLRIRPDQLGVGGGDGSKVVQTLTDGATITWDYSVGYNAEVTLGGNRTLDITNIEEGDYGTITVFQDGTGSRTLVVPGGTINLNSAANDSTVLSFYYDGNSYAWRDDAKTNFYAKSTWETPTAADNIYMWQTDVAITVSKVTGVVRGSSPSVTYQINFASDYTSGSPTTLFSSGQVLTNTTTGAVVTSFADATIPAGSHIWITTSAESGTTDGIGITLKYTID